MTVSAETGDVENERTASPAPHARPRARTRDQQGAATADAAAALLRSLADAVDAGTTLAWCVEHAPGGDDPVPAAWAACRDVARGRLLAALPGGALWLSCLRRWALGHREYWVDVFDDDHVALASVRVRDGEDDFHVVVQTLRPRMTLADVLAAARQP